MLQKIFILNKSHLFDQGGHAAFEYGCHKHFHHNVEQHHHNVEQHHPCSHHTTNKVTIATEYLN